MHTRAHTHTRPQGHIYTQPHSGTHPLARSCAPAADILRVHAHCRFSSLWCACKPASWRLLGHKCGDGLRCPQAHVPPYAAMPSGTHLCRERRARVFTCPHVPWACSSHQRPDVLTRSVLIHRGAFLSGGVGRRAPVSSLCGRVCAAGLGTPLHRAGHCTEPGAKGHASCRALAGSLGTRGRRVPGWTGGWCAGRGPGWCGGSTPSAQGPWCSLLQEVGVVGKPRPSVAGR